jgi:hypothetical protein
MALWPTTIEQHAKSHQHIFVEMLIEHAHMPIHKIRVTNPVEEFVPQRKLC